jgi:hypothetical protein
VVSWAALRILKRKSFVSIYIKRRMQRLRVGGWVEVSVYILSAEQVAEADDGVRRVLDELGRAVADILSPSSAHFQSNIYNKEHVPSDHR